MTEHATGAIVPDDVIQGMIDRLRKNIDACDEAIMTLLLERQMYSAGIRRQKQRLGQGSVDLSRERQIVSAYVGGIGRTHGYDMANVVLRHSKEL